MRPHTWHPSEDKSEPGKSDAQKGAPTLSGWRAYMLAPLIRIGSYLPKEDFAVR